MARDSARRIVLIDPHPVFRSGLEQFCTAERGLAVVGTFDTAAAGLRAIQSSRPDVAVFEFDLPDQRGPAVVRACRAASVPTRLLVLTARRDGADIYEAIAAGASGYVVKTADPAFICSAIAAVADGETVLDPDLHQFVAAEIRLHAGHAEVNLTRRERDVLELAAQGCTSHEIGAQLYVSETTVKTHLGNLYTKLGVSSRAAAVAQAIKRGLVEAT